MNDAPSVAGRAEARLPSGYWVTYVAAWVAVSAIYVTIFLIQGTSTLGPALRDSVNSTLSAALLGAIVVWWTGRPAASPRRPLALAFFAFGGAAAYAFAWMFAIGLGFTLQGLLQSGTWEWRPLTGAAVPWQIFSGIMVFTAIAGSGLASRAWAGLHREARRAARAEELRVRAELETLRARLHPHFLFNTLHSLRAQVQYDPEDAVESLDEFAELLRYALRVDREGKADATLAEEWSVCERYINLERIRLGDRLRTRVELAPEAMHCRMPTFLLQPLLENAIVHAVAPRREGGTVTVGARVLEGDVEIEVSDDGPGVALAVLDESPGLGLRSVRERLALLYPERSRVVVDTAPGEGFTVRLRFPLSAEAAPEAVEGSAVAS